jgi:thioester reductase-like protein
MNLAKSYTAEEIQNVLVTQLAQVLEITPEEVDITINLETYGLNSAQAMVLVGKIESMLGFQPSPVMLWHYPTIESLSQRLAEESEEINSQMLTGTSTGVSVFKAATLELDLDAECVLDPSISSDASTSKATGELNNVFLTGGTGFLGAFILYELLQQTDADVYCLVRAESTADAQIKVRRNLQRYGIWDEKNSDRIIPLLGDLSLPRLGLSEEGFDMLAANLDAVYHSGAVLNYVYPYSAMKVPNVLGTQEVLRLASSIKLKPVHYVSSVAIFESPFYAGKEVKEDDAFEDWKGIFLGYSQTKWVAEKLMKIAYNRGIPITIHRPPLIAGDSRTGACNVDDFINLVIKGCIQMGCFPDVDYMLDGSPVDYVSKAIVHLSKQKESIGHAFHLQHPEPVPLSNLIEQMRSFGFPIDLVPYEEWQKQLMNITSEDNPLFTLRSFLLQRWSDKKLTVPDLYLKSQRPVVSCQATLDALAGSGIVCPAFDAKLFMTYSAYLIENGFLSVA